MKLKIKVTKEVLAATMRCGTFNNHEKISENCAIAFAVRDIFPMAMVGYENLRPLGCMNPNLIIKLDGETTYFIQNFDSIKNYPELRLTLPEYEFEIELPDELVDLVNIADVYASPTLDLV